MYRKKRDTGESCPLEYGIRVFGGKWKARIICLLAAEKPLRFRELRSLLGDITDAVLSNALHELAEDGIVLRTLFDEMPPRVEYTLSERGKTVIPILRSICSWSDTANSGCSGDHTIRCRNPEFRLR